MTEPPATPRFATDADVEALVELVNEAYLIEAFFVRGPRCSPADVRAHLERGRFLVVQDDASRAMSGCVYVEPGRPRAYLGLLAVRPALQARGVGSRLLSAAERYLARTSDRVVIRIVDTRPELLRFYGRRGYVEVGAEPFSHPARLKRPCRFVLMEKPLRQ